MGHELQLIARGRDTDVFDRGDGTVLRRYRIAEGADVEQDAWFDTASEARLMLHLEEVGYPVPHVVDADGPDLVMERIAGGTVLDELMHEPRQYRRYGRLLGELHERLHRIQAPSWLRRAHGVPSSTAQDAGGDVVVTHGDLHPSNIILSERGPVVIDWTSAAAGWAEVDAATTVILTLGADLEVEPAVAERVGPIRGLLVDAFLETCGVDPRDGMPEAIAYRSGIPNNTPTENSWLANEAARCLDPFYLERRAL